ncbi:hypothetical protein [Sphingomonas sp.]|uniref:hypothetical protein n=1 Tax=Sphingomonas sp. TaxID=28214 RepID=UPI001D4E37AD|nr:hypothetical protein [Sphingomonas sp.]MBX9795270.1 hypothetical protein [Sphingomonas sp.]
MQRIRVALTGLAFVLLLIGLASAIFSSASRERPVATTPAPKAEIAARAADSANSQMMVPTNKEPLAELGVAPSASTMNSSAPASGPRR